MTKMFFDVFPTLEVNGDMKKLLSETEVTKVGMNHEKDHIRIYLNGTRLIHKKNIYQLEKNIHDQIFKNRHMDVKVIEKYQLSEQYTAEKLMDLYKDSILEELKNYSLMEYNLLRSAKMEFTGDSHLLLTLENTIIAQTRSHEIVEFLEKVVCERCGLDLSVELAFEEPKESKHKKNSDLQIQFEIKNILKRVQLHEESAPAKAEEVQPGNDVQTADISRYVVGSSSKIISVSCASVIAIHARCLCPPDNSVTRRPEISVRPVFSSAQSTCSMSWRLMPPIALR